MKRVDIISKVVGRDSSGKPVGGGISITMGNYALKSDVELLKSMFNDFLEGDDTDSVINRWKDLVAFLNGISEEDPLTSILGNYIPISGITEITGEKNFVGGLKVNGSPIYYDTEKKYWKLEGDLLVTGGVTMYGTDSDFVPSTIMDAILYDSNTLGINSIGQLYVKGSVGGATTMGSLSNVGSWADSVASQDRIMYQAANSSQWVAKNLSDLAVGGVKGDYLPLTGGTITNNSAVPLTINANNDGQVALFLQSKGNNKTYVGWDNSRGTCLYEFASDSSLNILNGVPRFNANTLWHSGNFTPSNYLPLSGGTLTGNLTFGVANNTSYYDIDLSRNGNFIKISNTSYKLLLEYKYSSYTTYHGLMLDEYGAHYTQRTDLAQAPTKYTLWHSGNDGSGSGLDADMLDGVHLNTNQKPYGKIPLIGADGVMEAGKYIDFHNDNTTGSDFSTRLQCSGEHGNTVSLPSASGTLALTTSNVSSATKLQTARTIWGQSFDGTGNVDGDLTANGSITMRTGTAFDASKYLTLTNNASQYGRIGITFNGSTQDGNDNWGEGGRSIISFRRKYGTATSYTFSYAIQQNLVDNVLGILYGSNVGILLNGAGNVGIGTTNPTEKLDINGNCRANHFAIKGATIADSNFPSIAMNYGNFISFGGHRAIRGEEAGLVLVAPSANGGSIIFRPMGNTATSTQTSIDTSGNMLVSGGVTMYSDKRKKTILNHVELSLKEIANAPLIEHYYNSDTNKTTHVGSIAQYWAEMNDWFCKKDSEGYYTMEIQNAALASAISVARELVKFETETDRRIRLLEEENKRLKKEIEQLKWNVA